MCFIYRICYTTGYTVEEMLIDIPAGIGSWLAGWASETATEWKRIIFEVNNLSSHTNYCIA